MKNFQDWSKEVNEAWFGAKEKEDHELARQPENVSKMHRLADLLKLPQGSENHESLWMSLFNIIKSLDGNPNHAVTPTSLKTIWNTLLTDPGYEFMKLNGIETPYDILYKASSKLNVFSSTDTYNNQIIRELKRQGKTRESERQTLRQARIQNKINQQNNPQTGNAQPNQPNSPQNQAPLNSGNLASFKNMNGGVEALNQLARMSQNLVRSGNQNEKEAGVLINMLIRMLS